MMSCRPRPFPFILLLSYSTVTVPLHGVGLLDCFIHSLERTNMYDPQAREDKFYLVSLDKDWPVARLLVPPLCALQTDSRVAADRQH